MLKNLELRNAIKSVFEVGCGSGPNLLLFANKGLDVGGIDYSKSLAETVQKVIPAEKLKECICDEAINMSTDIQYDAVLSNGVFHYFADKDYAAEVLSKMIFKARFAVGLVDIHDEKLKEDFLSWRRKETRDYDKLYEGLNKQFYSREWMQQIAGENNCDVSFIKADVEGYWNNDFVFDVYFYKR